MIPPAALKTPLKHLNTPRKPHDCLVEWFSQQVTKISCSTLIAVLLCLVVQPVTASTAVVIPETHLKLKQTTSTTEQQRVQTTTISHKKIENSPTTTLSDLLTQEQSVVRVTNNTNDNSQPVLSIRGFGDNAYTNSLIVVDGFPLTNPSILAPSFNAISLADIVHISIIQGSQGSLWGDQAVGGVVKIDTIQPEKPLASASIGYGSYHQKVYDMLLGDKFANGVFFKLHGFADNTGNYRYYNQQSSEGMSSELGVDYATGSLALKASIYNNDSDLPGGLTKQQYDSDPRQATTPGRFNTFQTQIYQLIHKQQLVNDWVLETRVAHNAIQGNGLALAPYTRQDSLNTLNPMLVGTLFNNKVTFGYEGQAGSFQVVNSGVQQKGEMQQNDLYTQVVAPLFSKLDLTLGGRSAWQDQNASNTANHSSLDLDHHVFVSEQGLAYHLSTDWTLFLRRDGNFRFAKANEQTALPLSMAPLLPQTGVSYETGTQWQTLRQTTQLSLYRLKLNDEIAYDPTQTSTAPLGSYSNLPPTLRYGATLSELYHFTDKLTAEGQINYVDARFAGGIDNHLLIPAVPALNNNLSLAYLFKPHWQVRYTALYTGSRYPSQDVTNTGEKLPSYWLSDISLQYLHQQVNVSFAIDNVFNQRYPLYTFYNPSQQTSTYYPGMGRNFLVTTKVFLS